MPKVNTIRSSAILHIRNICEPPERAESHQHSAVPDNDDSNRWLIKEEEQFSEYIPAILPGTMPSTRPGPAKDSQIIGGVRFGVSAKSLEQSYLTCWLAWRETTADDVWRDAVAMLRMQKADLLCEPQKPSSRPWLIFLPMSPWQKLSGKERAEIRKLLAPLAWKKLDELYPETP